uniref:RanBD1 domain-containing protein n=1 Tax=Echinostoma caproni TaxID=27848 RepID=A0A183AR75_9TREM
LVTALGALLSGRARAACDLNLESKQALDYEKLKAALVEEFSKEGDREKAINWF